MSMIMMQIPCQDLPWPCNNTMATCVLHNIKAIDTMSIDLNVIPVLNWISQLMVLIITQLKHIKGPTHCTVLIFTAESFNCIERLKLKSFEARDVQ